MRAIWVTAITALTALTLSGCGSGGDAPAPPAPTPTPPSPSPSPPGPSPPAPTPTPPSPPVPAPTPPAPSPSPSWMGDAEKVVGLAEKGIVALADPVELINLCVDAFQAVGKAFTHSRTISVAVETSTALAAKFDRLEEYKDDGVEFGWEHTDVGMVMTYHNDGPISGCQGFKLPDCGWELYVSAANPLMGHNKARVAFVPPNSGRNCYSVWDDMDSWGEKEGDNVDKNDHWDTYDNPSTISYRLHDVPDECLQGGMNASKAYQV